jgi:putative DNA primase/helicase
LLGLFPCRDPSDRRQLMAAIITALLSEVSRPILLFTGEHGAGKSTVQRLIKRLLDPTEPEMIRFGDGRDAMQKGMHCQVVSMDNLSALTADQIDMACRWVTGDSDSKRRNYTDDEDVVYKFKRQLLMNGINRPASRADFLDRCLSIELERIPKSQRMPEHELWKVLDEHHGEWLGAIFTLLSKPLAIKPTLKLEERARLADWEEYVIAITKAAGASEETYFKDRTIIDERQHQAVFDSSSVLQAVISFMENRTRWEGTATQLLGLLSPISIALPLTGNKDWPKTLNMLGQQFPHLAPTLAGLGITLTYGNESRTKHGRLIRLVK